MEAESQDVLVEQTNEARDAEKEAEEMKKLREE